MLNPTQLKLNNFQLLENGCYSPREVDNFLRQVTEDYSAMFAENGELVRKLGILAAKLEEYRQDESVLRDVLMNAQKNAELLIASAQQRANEMIEDANAQVQRIMKDGETIIDSANDKAHKISIAAEAEYESLIASAKVLADSYITTAEEKCALMQNETSNAVEMMLKDVEEQAVAVLEQAEAQAQAVRDEAAASVDEYVNTLREEARAEIEEKAEAARLLFEASQKEADRITADAAAEADVLLASVNEQAESLLSAALAQKEAIEISSSTQAEELLEDSRKQADTLLAESRQQAEALLTDSRAQADALVAEAEKLSADAASQYELQMREAMENAQALLDDGRNKAVTMLSEAQTVTSEAKQRTETSSQQIHARIKEQALKMLTDAKTYSDEVCEKVLSQAEQVLTAAKLEADRILSEAKEYADRTKNEITELSDARMAQAMDMSGSLISTAQADAQKIIATAQTRVSVAFDDVEGRIEQTLVAAEQMRVAMLEKAKSEAEETTKAADENAQRMMDEAIEKAADMLVGAKRESDRMAALTVDVKKQIAESISLAQVEYETLREKAMELRKKMLAQLLTEDEQAQETVNRSIRDLPEFDAEKMLREGMRRARESAVEIVADSKVILEENGLYKERTEHPEPVADVEAQSVPEMVESVQRRIDIDNNFDDLVTPQPAQQELPSMDMASDIDTQILHNAAIDVSSTVDTFVGEDGFVTIDESIIETEVPSEEESDDIPDFDSLISDYMAVQLDSALTAPFVAETQAEESIEEHETAVSEEESFEEGEVTQEPESEAEEEIIAEESEYLDFDESEFADFSDDFDDLNEEEFSDPESKPQTAVSEETVDTTESDVSFADDSDNAEDFAFVEDVDIAEDSAVEDDVLTDDIAVDDIVLAKEAIQEDLPDAFSDSFFDESEWESFDGFEDINDGENDGAVDEQEALPAIEVGNTDDFIAPIREDYVQEDDVFTDYDDSMQVFAEVTDPATEEQTAESLLDDFDSGFEIDFSVFEDVPRKKAEPAVPVADNKNDKFGIFRRKSKK